MGEEEQREREREKERLGGVEIDLTEQPSIYSTRWEPGVDVQRGGNGREADD